MMKILGHGGHGGDNGSERSEFQLELQEFALIPSSPSILYSRPWPKALALCRCRLVTLLRTLLNHC